MSLPLLIAINALAAIVLLAYAMSRTALLKPHVPSRAAGESPSAEPAHALQPSRREKPPTRPTAARQPASMSTRAASHAAATQES